MGVARGTNLIIHLFSYADPAFAGMTQFFATSRKSIRTDVAIQSKTSIPYLR